MGSGRARWDTTIEDFNRYRIFNEGSCFAERRSRFAVIAAVRGYLEGIQLELLWGGCRCGMQHCT